MKQFRKMYLPLAVLLSVTFGYVQGDNLSSNIDHSCQPFCNEYYPCCDEEQFLFKVDALYWRAHQEGLQDFIVTQIDNTLVEVDIVNFAAVNTTNQSFKRSKFNSDWRGGYRLGLGYNLCGWTMALDWTHYRGNAHGHGKEGDFRRSGHWKLDYDVVDFIVGTPNYCLGSCFNWNAFGGIRSARINQNMRTHTEDFSNIVVTTVNTVITRTFTATSAHYREHYNGVGPELGFNAEWNLGCGFSLCANATGAIVFGRFHVNSTVDTATAATGPVTSFSANASFNSYHDRIWEPVVDLGLGVCWQRHFCYCNYEADLLFKLGWEHHQWFHQGHIGGNEDLYLDGLTFSTSLLY